MRVLVAGATGVIGRALVPLLTSVGHDVVALSRTPGEGTVAADALDRSALRRAVREAAPDAVVNMLTAIPAAIEPRHLTRDFALTNRLRTVGTRNLYEAAHDAGVRKIVAQGLAYSYDPAGQGAADEDAPLWQRPPKQFVPVLEALKELELRTADAGGTVLRFGHLYGPGTIYAKDGSFVDQVAGGKVPLVGGDHGGVLLHPRPRRGHRRDRRARQARERPAEHRRRPPGADARVVAGAGPDARRPATQERHPRRSPGSRSAAGVWRS